MSVRQGLLAILTQGPCYGYQLRSEFDRRTGATWPLNVGQIYNTLERLERDNLVVRGDFDREGHVHWTITDDGRAEVDSWFSTPLERPKATRDDLAIKLAVATTLPGVDIEAIIRTQRDASEAHLNTLRDAKYEGPNPGTAEELAWTLLADSMILQAEADIAWLDQVSDRIASFDRDEMQLPLSRNLPRRGRPIKDPERARERELAREIARELTRVRNLG